MKFAPIISALLITLMGCSFLPAKKQEDATGNPLIPQKKRFALFKQSQEISRGSALAKVTSVKVEESSTGILLRVTAQTTAATLFDLALFPVEDPSSNILTIMAEAQQFGTAPTREVEIISAISFAELEGKTQIKVQSASNAITTSNF